MMLAWFVALLSQAPTGTLVWLDSTSNDLTVEQWGELEQLLRAGLRRSEIALARDREARASLVLQVRRIDAEYFVFVASGPAVAGSGVVMSRRIGAETIAAGALTVVLAQTAEELVSAALAADQPQTPPQPAPVVSRDFETPSPPAEPSRLRLIAEAGALADVSSGGLVVLGGGAAVSVLFDRFGVMVRGGAGPAPPRQTAAGVVRGSSALVDVGPVVEVVRASRFTLQLLALFRAQWLSAEGDEAVEGLVGVRGSAWSSSLFVGLAPAVSLTERFFLRLHLAIGGALRAVVFQTEAGGRLGGLSGLGGSTMLTVGAKW